MHEMEQTRVDAIVVRSLHAVSSAVKFVVLSVGCDSNTWATAGGPNRQHIVGTTPKLWQILRHRWISSLSPNLMLLGVCQVRKAHSQSCSGMSV